MEMILKRFYIAAHELKDLNKASLPEPIRVEHPKRTV